MNDTQTTAIPGTPDRRSNRSGKGHPATESNSLGDGEGIRINPAFRFGGSTPPADRGNAPTKQQFMIAIDEHAAASRAWNGHGPEVTAKRMILSQMLDLVGVK